jgi:hypothetical protein
MNAQDRQELLESLARGRQALLESLEGVSAETAERAPEPGKWTIHECVEHLAVSEDHLLARILEAAPRDSRAIDPRREELIRVRAVDRSRRFESPPAARPAGRFPTLAAALKHFLAGRERTVRFVESCGDDLRSQIAIHPLIGPATCYEMLLLIAAHPLRHAQQIEEIKSALR